MLTQKQYDQIKDELVNCKNPLYFFDDDPDGLCAFLLLYRYIKEGHGFVVKTHPKLDIRSLPKIEQFDADKVFILDIALVDQDFLDGCRAPAVWIDHHGPVERNNVKHFNPRLANKDVNIPTTYMCYKVSQQDIWIAMLGCVADYYMPDFVDEFKKQYPDLMNDEKNVEDIYFKTRLGQLIKIFSFCLKGKTSDVLKNIKVLTRIESPYEILNRETARGKFILRNTEKIKKIYDELLEEGIKHATKEKLLLFIYPDDKMSLTGDISNELLYKFPDKMIIVGRRKNDEVKMSIRSKYTKIPPILDKALVGLDGYGGGHEYACGANVKDADFEDFIRRIKESIS